MLLGCRPCLEPRIVGHVHDEPGPLAAELPGERGEDALETDEHADVFNRLEVCPGAEIAHLGSEPFEVIPQQRGERKVFTEGDEVNLVVVSQNLRIPQQVGAVVEEFILIGRTADQKVHAVPPAQLQDAHGRGPVPEEVEGTGRLWPHHQLGTLIQGLPGQGEVGVKHRVDRLGPPFLVLGYIGLDRGGIHGNPVKGAGLRSPGAEDGTGSHQYHRGGKRRIPPPERLIGGNVPAHDYGADEKDPSQLGRLGKDCEGKLGVTEQGPGKTREDRV